MNAFQIATLGLLTAAGILAMAKAARRDPRQATSWLQLPVALLLYWVCYPPALEVRGDALTVFTGGSVAREHRFSPLAEVAIALPNALAPAATEVVPDLATGLRRHPHIQRLRVLGDGLVARDQSSAADLSVEFVPSPERGLTELHAPQQVLLGHEWLLRGRAIAPGGRAELLDPAGEVADSAGIDANGSFTLSAGARGAGPVRFELRVRDAKQVLIETASVPLVVRSGESLRIIVRAGAANPEFKYWRRWATDAGVQLKLAATLTDGVALRDGNSAFTPSALADTDLVILDTRSWAALNPAEKTALRDAVNDGLGVLLRVDGLEPATVQDFGELGFAMSAAPPHAVQLDRMTGMRGRTPFGTAPVHVEAPQANSLLKSDAGEDLAWWQPLGRGRIGVWNLLDSFQLALLGESERYASLWSEVVDRLSRPRAAKAPPPSLPEAAWVDQRVTFCRLGDAARTIAPNGEATVLVLDGGGCAAYWPSSPGWHTLETRGGQWPFFVRPAEDGSGLLRALDRNATMTLMDRSLALESEPPDTRVAMSRWPFFSVWVLLVSTLWWLERPRS